MPFLVEYLQDIPKDCGECPCSIHITPKEVYCNARQKHFEVTDGRPEECKIIDCNEKKEADPSKYHICLNCIFNNGEAMHNKIICGYIKGNHTTMYKNEFDTCVNWFYKGETNAKLD